jgi:hypothetical protein
MKRNFLVWLLLLFIWLPALSAESREGESQFGITFTGFVKTDIFYDTRQNVSIREGHFLLFPRGPNLDPAGNDINAQPSFNMLNIQTRLAGRVTGPDTLGAATSGLIEGEFFGHTEGDINGFRLRHAYLRLNWPKTELLVGQTWHPMFVPEAFPDVVSFNTGAPFQPFNRSPQVRLTHNLGRFSIAATALSHRDFTSMGPGGANSSYLRNAVSPEMNLRAQYGTGDPSIGTETVVGTGVNYLKIQPRMITEAGYKATETVGGAAAMVFFKRRLERWTFKSQGAYGQNLHHLTMIGGYVARQMVDPTTQAMEYTPMKTASAWADVHGNGRTWHPGLFLGYSRNLGASDDFGGACYARGDDIDHLYRISPRVVFNVARFRFAAETEWTVAAYGCPDSRGIVRNAKPVGNLRVLLGTYLFF